MSASNERFVCHECDLLIAVSPLAVGEKAFCPRCDYLLASNRPHAHSKLFAYSLAALLFLIFASAFPFLGFSAQGQERSVTLFQSIAILVTEDFPTLAVLVFLFIIAIPALFLLGSIYVSIALALNRRLPGTRRILRWSLLALPWSMAEIFLVGILVSFIKIVAMADVALGMSFWSYVLFSVCMTIAVINIDKRDLWQRVDVITNG